MKKKLYYQKKVTEGLKGGPNYVKRTTSGFIESDYGQWEFPGEPTLINSNSITMKGVPYPVFGMDDLGNSQMMYPEQDYLYPGNKVYEIPMAQKGLNWKYGPISKEDSVRNVVGNAMLYEGYQGSKEGYGLEAWEHNPALPYGSTQKDAVDWWMKNIYPKVQDFPTAMEVAEAGDLQYNAGKDAKIFAYQEYLKDTDPQNKTGWKDAEGKWNKRKSVSESELDSLYNSTIGKLPQNKRRVYINRGRDWYYKNTAPVGSYDYGKNTQGEWNRDQYGAISPAYGNTWWGRIHATNDYAPLDVKLKQLKPKKTGGWLDQAQKGYSVKPRVGSITLKGQTEPSTHYMMREYGPTGWVVFPSIFQNPDNSWVNMSDEKDWMKIYKEAQKRGEVYNFGEDEEAAINFADKGSWKKELGIKKQGGWLDKAQEGGETTWINYLNPFNWGAPNLDKSGDFKQAFRDARIQGESDFMWQGKRYSTDLAPENKPEVVQKPIVEEKPIVDFPSLQKAVSYAESKSGKLMKNPESSATGLYGQLFSEIEDKGLYKGTRDEFAKDTAAQNRIFKKRYEEGFEGTPSLKRNVEDLSKTYSKVLKENNITPLELAALTNFIGRDGTRFYLGYVLRDKRPLAEVLPSLYGPKAKYKNKTPEEYLNELRTGLNQKKSGGWLDKAQRGKVQVSPSGYIGAYPTWSGDTGVEGDLGANVDFGNINFNLANRFNIESDPELSQYISPSISANIPFNKGRGNVNFSAGSYYNQPNITTGVSYKFGKGGWLNNLPKAQVGEEVPTIGPIDLPTVEISDKADPRALINQGAFFGKEPSQFIRQFRNRLPQLFYTEQGTSGYGPMNQGSINLPSTDISAPFVDPNTGEVDYTKMALTGAEGLLSSFAGQPQFTRGKVNPIEINKQTGKLLKRTKQLSKSDNTDELVDLWRIQEKGARPMSELAAEGKLGPMFQNEKAIQHFKDREKYFGQWFTKDKSDFNFYKADREFKDPEIIHLQVPKSKLSEYQNYDKSLSRASDREYVIPLEQQKQLLNDMMYKIGGQKRGWLDNLNN